MRQRWSAAHRQSVALLAEGVDRNCKSLSLMPRSMPSPSSRRAWIEIRAPPTQTAPRWVALLAEGVDRNDFTSTASTVPSVALLAEGVDRNTMSCSKLSGKPKVALLAEGVDRNTAQPVASLATGSSPSSRRAWIEMHRGYRCVRWRRSPSSRRAWIEILVSVHR